MITKKNADLIYLLGTYTWSETFVHRDLFELLKSDLPIHPVLVFAPDFKTNCPDWESLAPNRKDEECALSTTSVLATKITKHFPTTLTRKIHTMGALRRHQPLIERLCSLINKRKAVHVHAEFADLPALIAAEAANRTGCTYSIGVHARDVFCLKFDPDFLFRKASFITACNAAAADAVRSYFPTVGNLPVIHHGLDLETWGFAEKKISANRCTRSNVLFVGRCVAKKGIHLLLQTIKLAAASHIDNELVLTVLGDGPLERELKCLASDWHINENVRWKGRVTEEQVREHLLQADCLVVPSLELADGNKDGIPNVVLEAMACGTPVVGTQAGGLSEVLTTSSGWIVTDETPEALLHQIAALKKEPALAQKKCRQARALLEQEFDIKRVTEQRTKLFRHLLEKY